jgi:hypothetical protein
VHAEAWQTAADGGTVEEQGAVDGCGVGTCDGRYQETPGDMVGLGLSDLHERETHGNKH